MSTLFANIDSDWSGFEGDASILHEIAVTMTSKISVAEVNQVIKSHIESHIDPGVWAILLCDPDQPQFRIEMIVGEQTAQLQGAVCAVDTGVVGDAFASREPAIVEDNSEQPTAFFPLDEGPAIHNGVALPLVRDNRCLGVLAVCNVADAPSPADAGRLRALADFAAIAVENARQLHRVRELSVTDDVTSLYNARYLEQALEQEYSRSKRYGTPISVIFIDLDYFKSVNDNHGHLVGSEVLRETANILRQSLRVTDIATRYGGDEFVLILPETDQADALVVAQRCCEAMREHRFGLRHGADCKVTASFGVATLPDDTNDKLDLVRLSDQAMYFVKETSRDNISTVAQMLEARG